MKRLLMVVCLCGVAVGCGTKDAKDSKKEPVVIIVEDATSDINDQAGDDMGEDLEDMKDMEEVVVIPPGLEIDKQLEYIPNVVGVLEYPSQNNARVFSIDVEQKVDHFDENSKTFIQRMYLFHRDVNAPVVMTTSGYGLGNVADYVPMRTEASQLLNANDIYLGHRFHTGALPDPDAQDWSTLTIEQAAADDHNIVKSFKALYKAPWVGTGWSKGGMAVTFLEYYYPDDLDLVLPMSTPLSFAPRDDRYPVFLAAIGTEQCRQDLEASIIGSLARIEEMVQAYQIPEADRANFRIEMKQALASFPFEYWQALGIDACDSIPNGETAPIRTLVDFFIRRRLPSPSFPVTNENAAQYNYVYQAMTQIGYPDNFPTGFLDRLVASGGLSQRDADDLSLLYRDIYVFYPTPWDVLPPFDTSTLKKIDAWLKADARDMLAVYGAFDPWAAGKMTLNADNNSKVYFVAEGTHYIYLKDLPDADYAEIEARILQLKPSSFSLTQPGQVLHTDHDALRTLLQAQKL